MGTGYGWQCNNCGAGEHFSVGVGMMSFNADDTRALIARGECGKLAKQLLSKDFPLEVSTIDELAFYRCPGCGELIGGMVVRLTVAGDIFELLLPVAPNACVACGARFEFADDRKPVSEREIEDYVASIAESGCSSCGNPDVEQYKLMWD